MTCANESRDQNARPRREFRRISLERILVAAVRRTVQNLTSIRRSLYSTGSLAREIVRCDLFMEYTSYFSGFSQAGRSLNGSILYHQLPRIVSHFSFCSPDLAVAQIVRLLRKNRRVQRKRLSVHLGCVSKFTGSTANL